MDLTGVKEVVDQSAKVINWCLYLTGGSIVTLLGSTYIRPIGKKIKLSYFLFLLGWIFLGIAFKYGSDLGNKTASLALEKNTDSRSIDLIIQIHSDYSAQLSYFNLALYTFGAWLVIYLLWFIFSLPVKKYNR
ncbi:hypothetical protein ACFGVR_09910 [Mucilaginibacter sp. AW1-3]